MSLPKGFKRLEYIQSSGTQYVDTGFIPNQNTRVVMDAQFTSTPAALTALFGARGSASSQHFVYYNNNQSKFSLRFGGGTENFVSVTATDRNMFDLNKNTLSVGSKSITATSATFSAARDMYLFAIHDAVENAAGEARYLAAFKLYSCQIYDNGTLVRDFIPCQNASGAVGLWDAENEVFYGNAGTGTFTAGPVFPEIVDESEITELEYIQSNGTQYADTGFCPSESSRISFDFQSTGSTSDSIKAMFGARHNSDTKCFDMFVLPTTAYPQYGANAYNAKPISANILQRTVYDMNRNTATVNGVSVSFAAETFEIGFPVYLFTINDNGIADARPISGKLYACQIYDNGLLVRDYIPAKLSNGETGLYDFVFHEFYRNAGTGEFIAGPEMVHEGYTELEYIQSSGAQHVDTLFYPTGATQLTLDFQMINQGTEQQGIFGSRPGSSGRFTVFTGTSAARLQVDYNTQFGLADSEVNISGLNVNQRTLLEVSNRLIVNGAKINEVAAASFTSAYTLFLFANNNAGAVQLPGAMILYACQIYDNGVAVRIYVPMLHPSGVAGLWDSVNERFYASSTTTDLIAGPEAQTVPKAPANFRVESATDTLVTLAWDESDKAVGYRLYKSGQLLADTTETSVSVTVEPFVNTVFMLTAYNENGESAGTELTYFSASDNPILFLVTDRTQQDVALGNTKGTYNASDLNRVGYAVAYLADQLASCGVTTTVHPKTDWLTTDIPSEQVLVTYLQNVRTLRTALTLVASVPDVPQDMQFFTHTEANDIEMLLVILDAHITKMLSTTDISWAVGSAYTGLYAKEAYR